MNDSASILLLVETFEYQIGRGGPLVPHQVVVLAIGFDHQRVSVLADLALKCLPENTGIILTRFHAFLGVKPLLEAVEMDEPDTTLALTTIYQWVIVLSAWTPAKSASRQVLSRSLLRRWHELALNLLKLKELIVVNRFDVCMLELTLATLIHLHAILNDGDFLNGELDPAKLNDVSLLQVVIDLLVVVL